MKTILITGADGFAGSALLEHLRQQGYDVVAGVRNRARKLALEHRLVRAIVCDVSDAINVARVVASVRPDGIVHLAGLARPFTANADPLGAYQSIVTAWANVLDAVRRSVPRARVLLISSCDVYGAAGNDGQPILETVPPQPLNTFGSLKATAESVAHTFHRNYHLDLTIARPFHHTGPGQSEHFFFGATARRLADRSTSDTTLALPDLDCRRDILHVADVVEAYEALLLNGKPDAVYNVSSGQIRTCRALVQAMVAASGRTWTIADVPPEDDAATVRVLCGSNAKVCQETGWQPTRSPEDAVTDLMKSYLAQIAQPGR